jgi:hypothetical protein
VNRVSTEESRMGKTRLTLKMKMVLMFQAFDGINRLIEIPPTIFTGLFFSQIFN